MHSVRRFGTPARRAAVVAAIAASSLLLLAGPASAGKTAPPPPSASWTPDLATCSFTVTYTATGYSGTAYLRINVDNGGGLDSSIATYQVTLPRSGSVTKSWVFPTNGTTRLLYGRGSILKRGIEVSGSVANTPEVASTCSN